MYYPLNGLKGRTGAPIEPSLQTIYRFDQDIASIKFLDDSRIEQVTDTGHFSWQAFLERGRREWLETAALGNGLACRKPLS
jgi:hypothetical protein